MNGFDIKMKGLALLNNRVQDLLQDGYHVIINYKSDDLCLVKLRHHNGNRIVVKYNAVDGILSQHTNNIEVFHHEVC